MAANPWKRPRSKLKQLYPFVRRALSLQVQNLDEFAELIPEAELQQALKSAAAVNPVKGRMLSENDLLQEMEARAEEAYASNQPEEGLL